MKKGLLITMLFISVSAFAQNQSDKKSQDILKGLSNKYRSFKSLMANFTIEVENLKDKSTQNQKGTLWLKGQKYKLQIAGQEIISDGSTRWTYLKDANEVQIDNQKQNENAISPTTIFTMYEKGWKTKYAGEEKSKGGNLQVIELVPEEGNSRNVFKVRLLINKTLKTIASAKIFDKNGTVQTITVDKLVPDAVKDDSIFVFNSAKYPGADVIDLR